MRFCTKNYLNGASLFIVFGFLAGCSTIPDDKGNLSNYSNFDKASGIASKFKSYSNKEKLKNYNSIYIEPTKIDQKVLEKIGDARIDIVANLIDRTTCMNLAKSYEIRGQGGDDSLVMKLYITDFEPTGKTASALSSAIPVPVRIPIGLGKLSAESEILGKDNEQLMALKWSHKAAPVFTQGGLSKISDAYEFASEFADKSSDYASPNDEKMQKKLGDKVKQYTNNQDDIIKLRQKFCIDNYGKGPELKGFVIGLSPIGVPPEMYDKGKDEPK